MDEQEVTTELVEATSDEVGFTPTADTLEVALDNAEKIEQKVLAIKMRALKITNANDWVNFGDKPFLQASGAEKLATLFGVSWRYIEPPKKQILKDGSYCYVCRGEFMLAGKKIEVIGTCTEKDKFFSRGKAPEEIDEASIMKKASANMVGRGITTILGLRNLTLEELNDNGIYVGGTVTFKSKKGKAEPAQVIPQTRTLPKSKQAKPTTAQAIGLQTDDSVLVGVIMGVTARHDTGKNGLPYTLTKFVLEGEDGRKHLISTFEKKSFVDTMRVKCSGCEKKEYMGRIETTAKKVEILGYPEPVEAQEEDDIKEVTDEDLEKIPF
jgi:hypothetical protein